MTAPSDRHRRRATAPSDATASTSPASSSPARCCSPCSSRWRSWPSWSARRWRRRSPSSQERGVDFLTSDLSSNPANAGIAQGLIGTALLVMIVALTAFPIGIMTAIYLEEYSADNRLARFIDINIRNLAGVPSVVYGILGLTVFVALFANLGDGNGKTVMTGGLTLAVLILPLVIITSAEAIRSVPNAPARGRLRPRGLALAGRPPAHPAGGGAGHPDRHRPVAVAGDRRDRPAHPRRGGPRLVLDRRRPRGAAHGLVHRASDDRLRLGAQAAAGVPGADVGGDHRPAGRDRRDQCVRHPAAQPIRSVVVSDERRDANDPSASQGDPMTSTITDRSPVPVPELGHDAIASAAATPDRPTATADRHQPPGGQLSITARSAR